jgi:hypothetical protein
MTRRRNLDTLYDHGLDTATRTLFLLPGDLETVIKNVWLL